MSFIEKYFVRRRLRRLVALTLTAVTSPFQILVFIMLRIVSKVIPIRCGWIITPRIGHMAANFELLYTNLLVAQAQGGKRGITIWVPSQEHVCNRFLFKLIKRHVFVVPRWLWIVVHRLNLKFPGGSIIDLDSGTDRDINNLLDSTVPSLRFSDREIRRGLRFLSNIGLPEGAPFVCLNVRDSSYLSKTYPQGEWSYHDYRDSSIENYLLAANALTERGYYVFRMGAIVESPMPTSNPMIIDYASNGMRSEFLDIFLGAHCAFCISSGTGFDAIPYIFRRPIAYVNIVPVGICMTFSNRFTLLFKDHYDISTGLRMSLRSIFSADVAFSMNTRDFRQKNIELRQNSSSQIQDAVVEMMDLLEGNLVDTKSSQAAQLRFRDLFESLVATSEIAQHGQFKARYSAQELQKDPNWLM